MAHGLSQRSACNTTGGASTCWQKGDSNLLLVNGGFIGLFNLTPLSKVSGVTLGSLSNIRTACWIFWNSTSEEMATDWTKNLSRHLASRGGSSFIACSRTRFYSVRSDSASY